MFPKTLRESVTLMFWLSWSFLLSAYLNGTWQQSKVWTFFLACCGLISAVTLLTRWATGKWAAPVDIWESQQTLMAASGQRLPLKPTLTNDSLLYIFLTLEELSEFAEHAHDVMAKRWHRLPVTAERKAILERLASVAFGCGKTSAQGRDELAVLEKIDFDLTYEEATALLDDATDIAVTVAGLPLATGLPAREGYNEVATSNLSKRNPDTGRIDKHPDGKWIKGRNYKPPVLDQHLAGHYMTDR